VSNKFRRLPPLNTLVVFEAAFRHQNFTRAADEVALSPASVSRRIRELEKNLGVELFKRRRYDVVPTMDGEMLAATVRLSLTELLVMTKRIRKRRSSFNRLTIFSDISLANVMVVPLLGKFQKLCPEIKIRVVSSSEPIEFIDDEFDIGLQYGSRAEDKFLIEPIADEVIFPVCSPQLSAQLPLNNDPFEIAKLPLLHFSDPQRTWTTWQNFLESFLTKKLEPNKGLTFSSYQICLDAAEKGEGIALGWGHSVKSKIDERKLMRIPGMTLPESIFAYRRKFTEPNPVVEKFTKLLKAYIHSII